MLKLHTGLEVRILPILIDTAILVVLDAVYLAKRAVKS